MTMTINLTGARGGQGTTTTAAALALLAARRGLVVELVARDVPTMRALLGMTTDEDLDPDDAVDVVSGLTLRREPSGGATLVIGDNPHSGDAEPQSNGSCRLVVLRGPCYLSLRATIDARDAADGVVVVREQGRSVTNSDIAEITGLRVVAETTVTPHVARAIDAGVLSTTIHRRPEFAALDAYLETLTPDLETPHPTARPVCHIDHPKRVRFDRSNECTDLPLPLNGSGRRDRAERIWRRRLLLRPAFGTWLTAASPPLRLAVRRSANGRSSLTTARAARVLTCGFRSTERAERGARANYRPAKR